MMLLALIVVLMIAGCVDNQQGIQATPTPYTTNTAKSVVANLDILNNLPRDWRITDDSPLSKHPNTVAFYSQFQGFVVARKVSLGKTNEEFTSVIIDIGQFESEYDAKKVYDLDSGTPDTEASNTGAFCKSKSRGTLYTVMCTKEVYAFPFTISRDSFVESKSEAIKLIAAISKSIEKQQF